MRVRDLHTRIAQFEQGDSDERELADLLRTLLTKQAAHDDMSIQDLILRLKGRGGKTKPPPKPPEDIVGACVARLNAAFADDAAFAKTMDEIRAQRSVTKATLTKIFYLMFERSRGVPKSATRDELIRLIADERHILVRNQKMGQMLGRRIVPAE